eukprot:TRINITY_DN80508_c0_g1_i1.p1 TRINITY_DN80508_c0_g1~~TRINITY_DN80508_c0_g1_i1.p1  ORF type:complete len:202 (+),score=39.45 TRINITY_DN80508_c0_g1_i1:50-655(+)
MAAEGSARGFRRSAGQERGVRKHPGCKGGRAPRKRPAARVELQLVEARPSASEALPVACSAVAVAEAAAMAVVPQTPRQRRDEQLRGLELIEVPAADLSDLAAGSDSRHSPSLKQKLRPRRCCLPPLETWRNERVIFERPAGSATPRVRGVLLNTAADPSLAQWAERVRGHVSDPSDEVPEIPLAIEDNKLKDRFVVRNVQ